MTRPSFTRRAVAALYLERQHLTRPRARKLTPARLTRFVEDVGALQLDTINVVERAHRLTLFSRFGPYDPAKLDRLIYRRRLLFEYWAHAASMVPIAHLAPWRRAMLDYQRRNRAWGKWLKKNRKVITEVERAIRESGPLGSKDFENQRPGTGAGWWNWKPATHALDFLWMSGVTLVDSRVHFQKRFALAERVLPRLAEIIPPDTETFRRWHLARSLHAMGAATESDLNWYLTFPRIKAVERRQVLARALADGEVVEIEVRDDGARDDAPRKARGAAAGRRAGPRWYALAADLPALDRAGRRRIAARGTTLLSPFDSFLWYRDRVERLFGFDYTIEVYVPGHKRVHGYYSLPIFHDGQLIGRVDPKTHREAKRLEIKHVHFEPWFANGAPPPVARWSGFDHAAAVAGLGDATRALATFVGAERIDLGRVTPARLAPEVKRALAGRAPERSLAPV